MRSPEDDHLRWIPREALKAPLPERWKPCKTNDGEIYYFNFASGESVWDHPCDEYYKKLYKEEKALSELGLSELGLAAGAGSAGSGLTALMRAAQGGHAAAIAALVAAGAEVEAKNNAGRTALMRCSPRMVATPRRSRRSWRRGRR